MDNKPNGAAQEPPIEYPTIDIPGLGTFTVRFGFRAVYTLEDQLGMDAEQIGEKLRALFPLPVKDGTPAPRKISMAFLLKVLAACIKQEPEVIAEAFDRSDVGLQESMTAVGRVVAEAFAKTRWSARMRLQEPATTQELTQ